MNCKNRISIIQVVNNLSWIHSPLVAGEPIGRFLSRECEELCSPNGLYLLQWEGATVNSPHRLFLLDRKTGRKALFFEFERMVDIGWSPSGKSVFATDHAGSNVSQCFLFTDPTKMQLLDLGPRLL